MVIEEQAMTLAESRRPRRPMHVVRIVHRGAGVLLWLWVMVSVPLYLYEQNGAITVAGWLEMWQVEAEGGGPANVAMFLVLTVMVAALGVTLLIDLIRRRRRPFGLAGSPRGWLYLAHRWLGAAFAVTLVAYLAARLGAGSAPLPLGWTWLVLLMLVNVVGAGVFIVWAVGAIRRRGRAKARAGVAGG
jgi:hypothetical protein